MLNLDSWEAVKGNCGKYSFRTPIRDVYDIDVYEYTKDIEDEDKKVSYDGKIFKVSDYGTMTDYIKQGSQFYILAKPTKEKL